MMYRNTPSAMTIASLALLKTRYDIESSDIIDTLKPFLVYAACKMNVMTLTAGRAQELLQSKFGLLIPQHPLKLLLKRMARAKVLNKSNKEYNFIQRHKPPTEFETLRSEAMRCHSATISKVQQFVEKELDLYWSENEVEEALYYYIDDYSIECVTAFSSGSVVPVHGSSKKSWRYAISRFANYLLKSDPGGVEYLLKVITGRMLSNALLATDLTSSRARFKNTTLFLDTPVLAHVLGYTGPDTHAAAKEMMALVIQSQGKFAVFEHTITEINAILKGVESALAKPNNNRVCGNIVEAFRNGGKTSADAVLARTQLPDTLNNLGIKVISTPDYIPQFQIDESELEKCFEAENLFHRHIASKVADVNSIRSIYVLRGEICPRRVEESRAILVTNNSALARGASRYGLQHQSSEEVSPVITDFGLTNLVWLKSPLEAGDLPRKLLAANCYAALHPSDALWFAFLCEVDKLYKGEKITKEQYQHLRYELGVRSELMNLTMGDEDEITDKSVFSLIDRYEEKLEQAWKQKLQQEKEVSVQAQRELADERSKVAEHKRREREAAERNDRVAGRIERFCKKIRIGVSIIFLALVIPLMMASEGWLGNPEGFTGFWQWVIRIVSPVFSLLSILNIVFNVSAWNPINFVSRKIEEKVVKILTKYFEISPQQD